MKDEVRTHGLRCEVEPDRDQVVARPVGEIDLASVGAVGETLDELLANGWRTIVVDLRWVPFMDATGLSLVIRFTQRARRDGVAVRIRVAEGSSVLRLFDLTATRELLPVELEAAGPRLRPE